MNTKITSFFLLLAFTVLNQNAQAQVDVVYNNLVWSDEFETNGAVNNTKWHHQTLLPAGGSWFNGEQQHYTNELANSFVNNGFLNIKAIKEPYSNQGVIKQYTSARLNSKFAFMYGRVDVRAKVPTNLGTWPAIWLLGKNVNEDGGFFDSLFGTTSWPACGEIDIMEHGITQSQPAGYIQSAIHTPSSFGNTVNHGGTIASNLGNDYHIYSMNWSPFQITFLLDGVAFYTYNPPVKNASTWPFNAEQYLLLNIAMGGVAGTIPASFTNATMEIDYVRVYQNTTPDTQSPTNFTATTGVIGSSSVELLVNANDNSGSVIYNVSYGTNTLSFAGLSGVQKSAVISGLTPNTNYNFTITATDLAGNAFVNNPLVVNATTAVASQCNGTDNEAQQGSFTVGYNYEFETIGTDVKVTFEILDPNLVGVVGILWNQNPFTETPMTNVSGNKFTKTVTGQTIGATVNYAVKFAFAGGLAVTKYFPYVVGNNCNLGTSEVTLANDFTFLNPAKDFLEIRSEVPVDCIEIFNMTGILALKTTEVSDKIDISRLPTGIYLLTVYSGNQRSVKKLIVE